MKGVLQAPLITSWKGSFVLVTFRIIFHKLRLPSWRFLGSFMIWRHCWKIGCLTSAKQSDVEIKPTPARSASSAAGYLGQNELATLTWTFQEADGLTLLFRVWFSQRLSEKAWLKVRVDSEIADMVWGHKHHSIEGTTDAVVIFIHEKRRKQNPFRQTLRSFL